MPTVESNTTDGYVRNSGTIWSSTRDASSGNFATSTGQNNGSAIGVSAAAARGGGTTYTVYRAFLEFDFTGVTNVSSATLKLKNPGSQNRIRIVKATSFAPLGTGDFQNISGYSAGNTMAGNVTDFVDSNIIFTGGNAITSITLNSDAINEINAKNSFIIAVVGQSYDYTNTEPSNGDSNVGGLTFADAPGTDNDPKIEYVVTSGQREAQAGGTFSKSALRVRTNITTVLEADTDYEFKVKNNSKSSVYFNLEGAGGKDIFNTASFRTTTSDSGSNVLFFTSESQHSSFILAADSTSSFMLSSSVEIAGNNIQAVATNAEVFDLGASVGSDTASYFGADMEIIA